eukprot:SM000079S22422  [mRNA]  locus=s79:131246:134597:+ [translate_table: standard]
MSYHEPFRRLVKLIARMFYTEELPVRTKSKSDKSDNQGIAVVILDALARRQWVKEEELARFLKLHPKQVRRVMHVLEEERLVIRVHRRETVKLTAKYSAAVAATASDEQQERHEDGAEKVKMHTHTYCCLDYAQIIDVIRYRIHRAKKKLKDELEDRDTIQEYLCTNCARRFSAFDALRLINPSDLTFHCEVCDSELVAEADKLAQDALGDNEDHARRRRREMLKDMYERLERQYKPLLDQLAKIKELTPPDFGTLEQWERRAVGRGPRVVADDGIMQIDSKLGAAGGGAYAAPMPFLGETKVEVNLDASGGVKLEGGESTSAPQKIVPEWARRQGMNLTAAQRGEAEVDVKPTIVEEATPAAKVEELTEEEREAAEKRRIQEEYYKAYYAQMMARHQAMMAAPTTGSAEAPPASPLLEPKREVGSKVKREMREEEGEEGEEEEEDIEWEEGGGEADAGPSASPAGPASGTPASANGGSSPAESSLKGPANGVHPGDGAEAGGLEQEPGLAHAGVDNDDDDDENYYWEEA